MSNDTPAQPFRVTAEGLLLFVRVMPNAGADRIEGIEQRADGTAVLRLRVRAVPEKGRANAAVIALLAATFGVPRSSIAVTRGETAHFKTLLLTGDAQTLAGRLLGLARD